MERSWGDCAAACAPVGEFRRAAAPRPSRSGPVGDRASAGVLIVGRGLGGGRTSARGSRRRVSQASYEATLLAAVEQVESVGSNKVLLTRLGGSAFGNGDDWIDSAIERALTIVEDAGWDIVIVAYGYVSPAVQAIVDRYE